MKEEVFYYPNKQLKLGMRIWPEMFRELYSSRELIWRLFVRDWLARYKQAALGWIWALVMPFIAIGTFVFLNRAGILNIGKTDMPYPLFALIGLAVWQLFATGLSSGCLSVVSAGSMVSKINFPLEVLVFASLAKAIFDFLIKIALVIIFFFVFRYVPSWGVIFFPLAVIPILFLTLALALILSLVNGVLRDTANIVTLLTTFVMFLTPVLYPPEGEKMFFFKINPLSALISAPRDLIAHGYIKEPLDFFISSSLAFVLFFVSWRIFFLAKTKIPERL